MKDEGLKPEEQLTLEPYERDHAVVIGSYRAWFLNNIKNYKIYYF